MQVPSIAHIQTFVCLKRTEEASVFPGLRAYNESKGAVKRIKQFAKGSIDHCSSLKILPKSSHQKLPGVPSSHQAGFQGLAGVKHMFCAKLQSFRLFGLCILVASMHSILLPPASPQTCRSWLHKMPCLKSFRVLRSILQVI